MEWIWESYQISSELYAQIRPGQDIDEAYYQKYIPVIHKRINQAGIRLAGELNKIFNSEQSKTAYVTSTPTPTENPQNAPVWKLEEVKNAIWKVISIQGKVYSSKDIGSMVLVNLGAAFPNQLLTVALKGNAKELGTQLDNKTIRVDGEVIDY